MSIASELKDLVIKWGGAPTAEDDSIAELIAVLKNLDAPGGSGAVALVVNYDQDKMALDKTYTEIAEAVTAGRVVLMYENDTCSYLCYIYGSDKLGYEVDFGYFTQNGARKRVFSSETSDGTLHEAEE